MRPFDFLSEEVAARPNGEAPGSVDVSGISARTARLSRRGFLKVSAAASGAMLVSLYLPGAAHAASGDSSAAVLEPNVYVRIDTDGLVTITIPKSEMGQGVRTSLAMILAEELEADWSRVRVEQAPYGEQYGGQGTGGSGSVRSRYMPFREAGATARAMFIAAAAQQWAASPADLYAENSAVINRRTGQALPYGDLVPNALRLPVPEDAPLKDPKDFRLIGKARSGIDVPDIVTGKARYGLDVKVPGMLYAVIERTPVFGGKVARFDATEALAVPGVKAVFEVPGYASAHTHSGVAVVAEHTWAALSARNKLKVEWDEGPHAAVSTESLLRRMEELTGALREPVFNQGDTEGALERESERISAVYQMPFLSHCTMEPMNCTAHVTNGRVELWAPTQNPRHVAEQVSEALGVPMENVHVNVTLMGGGFGRRLWSDFAVEAAHLAKEVGAPVQVVWSREDDMRHGFYRPLNYHRLDAVLGADGYPTAWRHRLASTPIAETSDGPDAEMHRSEVAGAADVPYRIPNRRLEYGFVSAAVPRGWWRSVAHSFTTFAVEGFLNELAHSAGKDPYQYRLDLIDTSVQPDPDRPFSFDPQRLLGVLKLAAEKGDWGSPLPDGVGRGIAAQYSFSSYAAEVVEASVGNDGRPRIHRVVAVMDCGTVVNPDGARAQVMSALLDAASAALNVEITMKDGRVEQGNFHEYPILRMDQVPERLEIYFVDNGKAPSGLGEPAFPPFAAALADAIYGATGKRVRKLPIRPEDLRDA